MKKLELILIVGAIVGLLMALFHGPYYRLVTMLFFTSLGCLYYFFGFALLNNVPGRKIFKSDSYKGLGTWRILIAIGTGWAISTLVLGYLFSIRSYPMAELFLVVGSVFTAIMLLLASIRYVKERHQSYKTIILRCALFIIIGIIFLLLPAHIFPAS